MNTDKYSLLKLQGLRKFTIETNVIKYYLLTAFITLKLRKEKQISISIYSPLCHRQDVTYSQFLSWFEFKGFLLRLSESGSQTSVKEPNFRIVVKKGELMSFQRAPRET